MGGDFKFVGDGCGVAGAVELAPGVEVVWADEQVGGVSVGAAFLPLVVVPVSDRFVTVCCVSELVGEGGPVLRDAQAASGPDRLSLVSVVAFWPAVVADQADAQPFGQAG